MVEMFTVNANLNGLLESADQVYVSDVFHKAFIEVNEEGSEAAAAGKNSEISKCSRFKINLYISPNYYHGVYFAFS